MNKTIISGVISLIFSTSTNAKEPVTTPQVAEPIVIAKATTQFSTPITTADVLVKANRFVRKDTETTYASEIHTEEEITASGAATLYDFLAQQTSLNVLSSFGNKLTPSINLRGFGNENGSQNVVITLDGQRLNNIDSASQLLGAIPLGNIERIEISKGSGSVIYGDGATAGAIQIYTKKKTGVTVSSSLGNYGQKNSFINAGISEQYIDLSASLAHDGFDGFSKKDSTGHRDESSSDTQNVKLAIKPIDGLRLIAEGTASRNDIRYVNPLTRAKFKDDPRQNGGGAYTNQNFDTNQWRVGLEYDINQNFKLNAYHFNEDKFSEFVSAAPSTSNSIYKSNDISLQFNNDLLSLIAGYQDFDGKRKSFNDYTIFPLGDITSNTTTKKNEAIYFQGEVFLDALTLSAGIRDEKVRYKFTPDINPYSTPAGKDRVNTDAWDIGANYRFNNEVSIFTNYNRAVQAPDIDRLFGFGGGFNGFIDPMKAKTLNVGLNHVTLSNRLKIIAFHANLNDEIYLVPRLIDPSLKNTNLDKSYKYGFEIQDFFRFNNQLDASVIYSYTRAKIDREIESGVSLKGKDLPGVPKHTLVANLNYKFLNNIGLNLNHTLRSEAFAFDDFQNNFTQRQDSYSTTNIALNYQYKSVNIFTSVNNIFEKENSIQINDGGLYPVDFVRTWRVGLRADF